MVNKCLIQQKQRISIENLGSNRLEPRSFHEFTLIFSEWNFNYFTHLSYTMWKVEDYIYNPLKQYQKLQSWHRSNWRKLNRDELRYRFTLFQDKFNFQFYLWDAVKYVMFMACYGYKTNVIFLLHDHANVNKIFTFLLREIG